MAHGPPPRRRDAHIVYCERSSANSPVQQWCRGIKTRRHDNIWIRLIGEEREWECEVLHTFLYRRHVNSRQTRNCATKLLHSVNNLILMEPGGAHGVDQCYWPARSSDLSQCRTAGTRSPLHTRG